MESWFLLTANCFCRAVSSAGPLVRSGSLMVLSRTLMDFSMSSTVRSTSAVTGTNRMWVLLYSQGVKQRVGRALGHVPGQVTEGTLVEISVVWLSSLWRSVLLM